MSNPFQNFLMDVESVGTENCADMITEIGDSLRELQYFDAALKFYLKLEHTAGEDNVGKLCGTCSSIITSS